jgi:exopolysaccharide biosynthesis polyprenyl glycosylphosphotransferase
VHAPARTWDPSTHVDLHIGDLDAEAGLLGARPWQLAIKRLIDVVGALVLLILLAPVFLVTAAAVKLSSPGPVFFKQWRVGERGRPFLMWKFRSMYVGAERERDVLAATNGVRTPVFKIRDDPRVTPVGRFIRRTSIDELPQLWNVLRGEMSLVGPRPPLIEEFLRFGPRERSRCAVRPGLTCIWQVSGRSDLDFETWVEYDLRYIREWRLTLDLVLLARTVPAVLGCRGAY